MHNGLDAYEARLAELEKLIVERKQGSVKVDSQHSETTDWLQTSPMALYAAWQDDLVEAEERNSSMPTALVDLIEDMSRVRQARDALASGKEDPPVMEVPLATQAHTYLNKLDYYMDMFPQHIQACASGPRAGLTVTDREEALGLESLSDSDMKLLSWELRKRPLTKEPTAWPDCSIALSTTLISNLTGILKMEILTGDGIFPGYLRSPDPNLILSIGSGSGLLEAHLQSCWSSWKTPSLQIHGVEVRSTDYTTPNRYLLFKNRSTVRGTWEVSSRLLLARVLIFVYPRQVSLVKKYMDEAAHNDKCRVLGVIWLGPKRDWDEGFGPANGAPEGQQDWITFKRCFEETEGFSDLRVMDSQAVGLPEYEMMAFVTRKPAMGEF